MDYTQLIETYYINRDVDHHLVKGEPITTNEGAIGMTTTTGGSTGDKSCSVVNYYHNHSYYIQAYQWGNIWPERSAIAMSTPNHDNIAIVFDI